MSDKRGGQRNRKKPDVDREHLRDVVDAYVRKMGTSNAFEFSPYGESLGKQCACSAKGLVKAKEFLKVLNKANPEMEMKYSVVKEILEEACKKWPDLKKDTPLEKQLTWSTDKADMVMVLLAHVRRLRSERRWKECLSKATEWQCEQLQELRALVLEEAEAEGPEENTPEKYKKKRALEEINSFELPDTPAGSPGGLTEAAEGCSPVPASKQKIKASLGMLAKRPAGKQKKPAAMPVKAQKKKATAEKKELTAGEEEFTPHDLQRYWSSCCESSTRKASFTSESLHLGPVQEFG